MNAQTNSCDHRRIDDFLNSHHVGLEDEQLMAHLGFCDACREYMETQAADPDSWSNATKLLQAAEFDRASSDEYSVATIGYQRIDRPVAIQSVLDSLAPSDDPNRLGRLATYEVSGVVGAGGMGVVLKAIDPSLDRVVAIKVLAAHLANNGSARKRFSREAKAAAAVLHPNIIPIHSVSSDDALPYLVMAYVRGGSLQERLKREGPLPTVEILRIGSQIATGLAAAHEQGLVHRDIKPENILLEEGVERVTLTDFGLARAVDDASVTREGTIAGTPQYMSPEQTRGESVDHQSDLFSLGSVLYTVCTGRAPFRADSSYGVMRLIADEEPTSILELNPEIPEWLISIIEKLMAKEKADRFESAGEVHELLEACLGHVQQPSSVRLPTQLLTKIKSAKEPLARRRFATFALIGLSMIMMVAAVFFIQSGKTTLRFEIDAPNVKVAFAGETITVAAPGGKTFRVGPSTEQKFTVYQDGVEVETDSLTLRRGDKVVLKIDVVKGQLKITSNVPNLQLAQKKALELDSISEGTKAGEERSFSRLGMKFCWCPPGKFTMGRPKDEPGRSERDVQVNVTLTDGFWMAKYEVTQSQWKAVVSNATWNGNSRIKVGPDIPAAMMTWGEASSYCERLTEQERRAGRLPEGWRYTLPSDAQWEYACRAGTKTRYSYGDDQTQWERFGWGVGNGPGWPHPVGKKLSNPWNLHDMYGNMGEWCRDWHQRRLPGGINPEVMAPTERVNSTPSTQPQPFTVTGPARVYRCGSSIRSQYFPHRRDETIGFRVALVRQPKRTASPSRKTILSGKIAIDGSSKLQPISVAIRQAFSKPTGKVRIGLGVSGTDGGFTRFAAGEIDISNAGRPIRAQEMRRCQTNGVRFLELPVAYDAVIVTVNPKNTWVDKLTVEQLKYIFVSNKAAAKWSDVDPSWPKADINIYAPGIHSGVYAGFKRVVAPEDGSLRSGMSHSEDDNALVKHIVDDTNAIGFFAAAYFFDNNETLKAVPIVNLASGMSVLPTPDTIKAGEYAPFSQPLLVYLNVKSMEREEVNSFMQFYLRNASGAAERMGFIPLSENIYEIARKHLSDKICGTHFLSADGKSKTGTLVDLYRYENVVETIDPDEIDTAQ